MNSRERASMATAGASFITLSAGILAYNYAPKELQSLGVDAIAASFLGLNAAFMLDEKTPAHARMLSILGMIGTTAMLIEGSLSHNTILQDVSLIPSFATAVYSGARIATAPASASRKR